MTPIEYSKVLSSLKGINILNNNEKILKDLEIPNQLLSKIITESKISQKEKQNLKYHKKKSMNVYYF